METKTNPKKIEPMANQQPKCRQTLDSVLRTVFTCAAAIDVRDQFWSYLTYCTAHHYVDSNFEHREQSCFSDCSQSCKFRCDIVPFKTKEQWLATAKIDEDCKTALRLRPVGPFVAQEPKQSDDDEMKEKKVDILVEQADIARLNEEFAWRGYTEKIYNIREGYIERSSVAELGREDVGLLSMIEYDKHAQKRQGSQAKGETIKVWCIEHQRDGHFLPIHGVHAYFSCGMCRVDKLGDD